MSFNRDELEAIEAWTATAKPLSAVYYRSVEYRFMDPKEVLSGRGAALYGGRFASVGTPAVFLAESDSAASEEVLARKRRLGGSAPITLDKYPASSSRWPCRWIGYWTCPGGDCRRRSPPFGRAASPRRFHSIDGMRRPLAGASHPRAHLSQHRWSGEELDRLFGAMPCGGA